MPNSLAEVIAELAAGIAFPARLRLFCDPRLGLALPEGAQPEWPGLDGAALAAAACGAALAERERGGRVLAVTAAVDDGLVSEAATLAGRLGLDNLHVVLAADEPGLLVRFGRPAADRPWGQGSTRQVALHANGAGAVSGPLRREWPPVRLAALPIDGSPPWPASAGAPRDAAAAALAWTAEREPRLLLPHTDSAWRAAGDNAAKLLALAHLCAEGLRVAWLLPRGAPLMRWLDALREIGRRGLAFKLLCDAEDLPLHHLAALPGWWIGMPGDAAGAGAMLAHTLATEDAFILALPAAAGAGAAFPPGQPWYPGSGRWLAEGSAATIACAASAAPLALAARAALDLPTAVLQCTSLHPLPLPELRRAAARAPLIAIDEPAGFARLVAETIAPARCAVVARVPGKPLDAGAVVAAVRTANAESRTPDAEPSAT